MYIDRYEINFPTKASLYLQLPRMSSRFILAAISMELGFQMLARKHPKHWLACTTEVPDIWKYKNTSKAWRKTAVTPLLTHWSYCSLVLSHRLMAEVDLLPRAGPFIPAHDDVIKWKHFPRYWPFVWGIHRWIPCKKAGDTELWCFLWLTPE